MHYGSAMRPVSIDRAKDRLSELVDAAVEGERVVLKRGSRRVAAIVPLEATLADAQAHRLWQRLAAARRRGKVREFPSAEAAIEFLHRRQPRGASARRVR